MQDPEIQLRILQHQTVHEECRHARCLQSLTRRQLHDRDNLHTFATLLSQEATLQVVLIKPDLGGGVNVTLKACLPLELWNGVIGGNCVARCPPRRLG